MPATATTKQAFRPMAERPDRGGGSVEEIRRKLRQRDGVTIVFALAVFLMMSLFCGVMVDASLAAARTAYASQTDERSYVSVRAAAALIQRSLKQHPRMEYDPDALTPWTDHGANNVVKAILLDTLNGANPRSFTWRVESANEEARKRFKDVRLTVAAEARDDSLTFVVRFDSGYKMTMRMTAFREAGASVYNFEDGGGNLRVETSLGAG